MLPGRKTMTGFAIVEDIVKEMLKVYSGNTISSSMSTALFLACCL
jgi:hypothetical protein